MASGFKAVIPGKFKAKEFRLELLNAQRKWARAVRQDFKKTVASWDTKVDFQIKVSQKGGMITSEIVTDSQIYAYVDKGTKPHVIRPVRAKVLRFGVGGKAKTTPNVIGSGTGAPGTQGVVAREVHHPGTKARNFSVILKEKWEPIFAEMMAEAIARAAEKSGHAIG